MKNHNIGVTIPDATDKPLEEFRQLPPDIKAYKRKQSKIHTSGI